jgi:hypothetical protein
MPYQAAGKKSLLIMINASAVTAVLKYARMVRYVQMKRLPEG